MYFLQDKKISFIAWICPLLKQRFVLGNEIVYFEGDQINNIYFMKSGTCSFVLPKYENAKYINVSLGYHFGMEDLVQSVISNEEISQSDWIAHKEKLVRSFTVIGDDMLGKSTIMLLSATDLNRMQVEFQDVYANMFDESYKRLEAALNEKLKAMKTCQKQMQKIYLKENYEENKNLTKMKKHRYLTSFVELCNLVKDAGPTDKTPITKIRRTEEMSTRKSGETDKLTSNLGKLMKSSQNSIKELNFTSELQKVEEIRIFKSPLPPVSPVPDEELSKSARYRKNVAAFVEKAKKMQEMKEKGMTDQPKSVNEANGMQFML